MTTEKELSPKWQKRFDFFDKYGTRSNSPEYKAAYKALPFKEKLSLQQNFIAFFFGLFYFFILGLWRKNITLIGIIFISGVILYFVEETMQLSEEQIRAIDKGFQFGFAALYSLIANKAYYLHKVKGSRSWNPFEGGL
ncbi:DUF2628 domain-containing protein [Aggregatibacter kilianii]|uniref:DUF2628 domain-containing protein n=1 Tax=Aggregatibacter kilianii TaxID=2025884 RepID=UPI000D64D769|nr:DUF2628 domain-containing protein [Aggregatibacter kilianii]